MSGTVKNKSQKQKFSDLAREAGCDPDESAFDKKLKKIATAPPPKDENPKKKNPDR